MRNRALNYVKEIEVLFNGRLTFFRKFSSLVSSETFLPLEMESNYFLFNLSLIFISWEERTVITHKELLMTVKMASWLIISYQAIHLEHLQIASMGAPVSAQARGRFQGFCVWGVAFEQKKKHRNKGLQLEIPLATGRNKDSECEIFEHFRMYF